MPNATTTFRVEVVGQVYKTTRLRIPLEEHQPACTQLLVHLPESRQCCTAAHLRGNTMNSAEPTVASFYPMHRMAEA